MITEQIKKEDRFIKQIEADCYHRLKVEAAERGKTIGETLSDILRKRYVNVDRSQNVPKD